MTEQRRLNGLTIKEVWAWWNWDAGEVDGRGRRCRRMTRIRDGNSGNLGEVLAGVKMGGGANCLVVYAELPKVVRSVPVGSLRGML